MQTLVCFWVAILALGRNSLSRRDFLTYAIADVLLGHDNGSMPKLISGLHDVATRFGLVRTGFSA